MVATLMSRRSSRSNTEPSACFTCFCSMKMIAIECPTLGAVKSCIRSPPMLSRVMFTCGSDVCGSYPCWAFVTRSPVTMIVRCSRRTRPSYTISSISEGRSSGSASRRNSRFANLSRIRFAADASCMPGRSTTMRLLPSRCTSGSETPISSTRLRRLTMFLSIASSSISSMRAASTSMASPGRPITSAASILWFGCGNSSSRTASARSRCPASANATRMALPTTMSPVRT